MKSLSLIYLFILLVAIGEAQSPADWWYFGQNAGIHFTFNGPIVVNDGEVNTDEGCSSISDNMGNLLFYSDGSEVYDRTHDIMPNGYGLLGDESSTHSVLIVPRPGSNSDFYVFTADDGGTAGLGMHYSKVDMSLNAGFGDIDTNEKNVFLVDDTSEKVAVVKKANGYWIITHLAETSQYYTYEVTSSGVNTTPIISNTAWNTLGFGYGMAVSTSGTKLASVYSGTDSIHVYNVNLNNGQISSSFKIGSSMSSSDMYGLEFSPNSNVLYMQSFSTGDVRQFDLTAGSSAAISASEAVRGGGPGGGQLQLGPDGRIYCARFNHYKLSVIENPNTMGGGCNWVDEGVILPSKSKFGLPSFVQSFFRIRASPSCFGDTTFFNIDTNGLDSVIWEFGDPTSGIFNYSEDFNASHLYQDSGLYQIQLITFSGIFSDTCSTQIRVYPRQFVDLGADTLLCVGSELEFIVSQPFAEFVWHDSSIADTFLTKGDSLVHVSVFGICDTVSDSVFISYEDSIMINLGPDSILCKGEVYKLKSKVNTPCLLEWNTSDSSESIEVTRTGIYSLVATNSCGFVTDSVELVFKPIPTKVVLPNDTVDCADGEIVLKHPNLDSISFVWSDSSTKRTYVIDSTEIVWLAVFNECGFYVDTMEVISDGKIITDLGADTNICDKDSILLNAFSPGAAYIWNTGDTADSIYSGPESQLYVVTITQGLCTTIESKRVELSDVFCPSIDCELEVGNVITPNGDGINDTWKVVSNCDITQFNLRIYNRWGQLVFSSTNVNIAWDGTVYGSPAADGVYFYELEFKDTVIVDVDREDFRGSITLIR